VHRSGPTLSSFVDMIGPLILVIGFKLGDYILAPRDKKAEVGIQALTWSLVSIGGYAVAWFVLLKWQLSSVVGILLMFLTVGLVLWIYGLVTPWLCKVFLDKR
jgi:hypothetical protein